MKAGFELFDHTADVGVRVRAESLAELIRPAAEGLYATIGTLEVDGNAAAQSRRLVFDGNDAAVLLRDLLNELLFIFERDHACATQIDVREFSDRRVAVDATLVAVDFERSSFAREVKAITYHALDIRQVEGGYEAEFIVDI